MRRAGRLARAVAVVALLAATEAAAAIPTYRGSGTFTSVNGNTACTAPMPTGVAADDILLLVVETENEAVTLSTPNGFVEVTNSPQGAGTAATAPANRLTVYWKRAVGGDTSPSFTAPSDHASCQLHAFVGVRTAGNPWNITAGGNDGAANDTTAVIPGATTTAADCLVVLLQGSSTDATGGAQCGAATNASLANILERTDLTGNKGSGGGHCLITGEKASSGAYGNTTLTLATTSFKGALSIALEGAVANGTTAGTVTAPASGCGGIAISAPYTGDPNTNNTLSYRLRTPATSGTWGSPVPVAHSASPYSIPLSGLTHLATYDVEVTYLDADGVTGTAIQTVSNITIGANCTAAGTVSAAQTTGATPSIGGSATYTGDANANNTLSYRTRTPPTSGTWTSPTSVTPHQGSPFPFTIGNLTCGASYDVEVTYVDADGIGSGTAVQSVANLPVSNCTLAGTATASATACNSVTVSAPFTQDVNANGTAAFDQGPSATGPWTAVTGCGAVGGGSPRQCIDTNVVPGGTYWYRVTYSDGDAVGGTAQQITTSVTTPSACVSTAAGTATATPSGCTAINVSAPYTGDSNANNTLSYRTRTPSGGTWGAPVPVAHSASPYAIPLTGLTHLATYDVEVTYLDAADGVTGTAVQTISNVTVGGSCTGAGTMSAAQTTGATPSIGVTAPYTGDTNSSNTLSYRTRTTGPWSGSTPVSHQATPYSFSISSLTCGTSYDVEVTYVDADGIPTGTAVQTQLARPVTNCTTAGTVSGSATACDSITVSATFTNNANSNGSVAFDRGPSGTGPWTAVTGCEAVAGASPRQCVDNGRSGSTQYFYRATFTDPDAVAGGQPVSSGISTPACAVNSATPGTPLVTATACGQLTVSMPFTGDDNANSTTTVEWNTSNNWPGTVACTGVTGLTPRSCVINGVPDNQGIWVRVTFSDADGVSGTNPQAVGPTTSLMCGVSPGVPAVSGLGCSTATVSTAFTGDTGTGNSASTTTVEWNTSNNWPGTVACLSLTGASPRVCNVTGLPAGTPIYFRVTFTDSNGVYGTNPQVAGPNSTTNCNVTTGALTATATGCSTANISVSFTGDTDGNATTVLEKSPDGVSSWTAVGGCGALAGASPRTCSATGLVVGVTNYLRVTFGDSSGVSGPNPVTQTVVAHACNVTPGTPTATPTGCATATVSSPYTGDTGTGNTASTTRIEWNTSQAWPGTVTLGCDALAGASPRVCNVTGLPAGTLIYFRVSYTDPDNTPAATPQVVTATTTACNVTTQTPTGDPVLCDQVNLSAPFSGDTNSNSTTVFNRGPSGTGPWTAVTGCGAVAGASPRLCTDTTTVASTLYYYQVDFVDADGVSGPDPQVIPVTTPQCPPVATMSDPGQGANANVAAGGSIDVGFVTLTVNYSSVTVTSVGIENTLDALPVVDVLRLLIYDNTSGAFYGAATWDGAKYKALTSFTVSAGTPVTLRVHLMAATGATATRRFTPNFVANNITVASPARRAGTTFAGRTFTITAGPIAGSANPAAPTVMLLNPANGAALTGPNFKVQAQVYNPAGLTGMVVTLSTDNGGTFPVSLALGAPAGTNAALYEATVNRTPGAYALVARATNGAALSANSNTAQVSVAAAGTGDGNLLVRDNSSQLCVDCHAMQSHSSQYLGGKYGAWAVACRDCHTPHNTTNIYLVKKTITPPAVSGTQAPRTVRFSTDAGYDSTGAVANASYANSDNSGPCQVCHTRTKGKSGQARYQNAANADTHYSTQGTERCTNCHTHSSGFKGQQCVECHLDPTTDVDNFASDRVPAKISTSEWTTLGHGLSSASYYPSDIPTNRSPGAGMDTEGASRGDRGCLYCHDDGVGHGQTANPFRLANTGGLDGMNGTCLACHKDGSDTGFDPDGAETAYAAKNSTKKVGKTHFNNLHGPTNNGGQYCWDCHDPHGDKDVDGNAIFYMMHKAPWEKTTNGLPTTFAPAIKFNKAIGGSTAGTDATKLDYRDYFVGGLCKGCHADGVAAHYTKTSNDAVDDHAYSNGYNPIDAPNDKCTDCHKHIAGLKQLECNGCHNSPSARGYHRTHNDVGWVAGQVPLSYTKYDGGTTATTYGYACHKCHSGTHQNELSNHAGSVADPFPVEVLFDTITPPINNGATYNGIFPDAGALWPDQVETGTDANKRFSYTRTSPYGRCTNLYCHSNGDPLGKSRVAVTMAWGNADPINPALSCTMCHTVPGTNASTAHTTHVTTYGYTCVRCHSSVTSDGATILDKRLHVDGFKTLDFDNLYGQTAGAYDPVTHRCSNTYCHSDGQALTAGPYTNSPLLAWDGLKTCASCHQGTRANATVIATGKHTAHVNNDGVLGTSFTCYRCHSTTVNTNVDAGIATPANHVDGAKTVSFTEAGTYTLATKTCASSYCHSSGQATPTYRTIDTWNSAALYDCKACHGADSFFVSQFGEPNYQTGNSHGNSKHVAAATDCAKCHDATTATGTSVKAGAPHIDNVRDVVIAAAYDTNAGSSNYNSVSKTCTAVSCHGSGQPVWGSGAQACDSCHSASSALLGSHSIHWGTATVATDASADVVNASAAGNYQFGCKDCHPRGPTNHAAGSVSGVQAAQIAFSGVLGSQTLSGSYAPAGTSAGTDRGFSYTAGTCTNLYCHSNAAPVGGTNSTKSPVWTSTVTCTSCHNTQARGDSATLTDLSNAHGKHIQSTSGETGSYSFTCDACHAQVIRAAPNSPWLLTTADINNRANHVNGQLTVTFSSTLLGMNQSAASYTGSPSYTCANTYCHSNGAYATAPFGSFTSLAWTGATTCYSCHGTNPNPAPSYASGSPKANTHSKHAPYTCQVCHSTVVNATPAIISQSLHVNGAYNLAASSGQFTVSVQGTPTTPTTCATITCHGGNSATWGTTLTCLGCHGTSAAETDDLGATFWANGITATINTTEWTYSGHGKASGSYDVTANPAAAFSTTPTAGTSECLYCHDDTVNHQTSTNPFRLRGAADVNGLTAAYSTAAPNANCLNCHLSTAQYGVDPTGTSPLKKGTKFADATHDGTKHTVATQGGKFCWDCHDPHGERPSNTNSSGNNIIMIGRTVQATTDGTHGYLGASGVARSVQFYNKTAHVANDTGDTSSVGKIAESNTALGTAHVGLCQACHDVTDAPSPATAWTKYWEYTGYDDPTGNPNTDRYRSGRATAPLGHNASAYCISCHGHATKFAGGGGGPDCLGCHGPGIGSRRPLTPDFALQSHHVGNGGTMGGTLSNFDCVVCHAEGQVVAGAVDTDATYHNNGIINLRNVDAWPVAQFPYDKAAITGAAGTWNSSNANWVTQTSTNLDPFCLTCHDGDGALQIANFRENTSQTALNPFADTIVTNNVDQQTRSADGTTGAMRVVDIKARVTAGGTDLDPGVRGGAFARNDPPQGIYSRHAIRNQSLSVYVNTNANWDVSGYWISPWASNSVMGCADCHTTDGANTTTGNAHGSQSEYLLKDSSGTANEGSATGANVVCFKCHNSAFYNVAANHTGCKSNFVETMAATGTARYGGSGNIFGYACGNCHGGVLSNSPNREWGTIHGTSQVGGVGQNGATGTRNAYRFTNGNALRFYDPQGWTGTSATCYTLGTGDTFSTCTQHGKGTTRTKASSAQRPLAY